MYIIDYSKRRAYFESQKVPEILIRFWLNTQGRSGKLFWALKCTVTKIYLTHTLKPLETLIYFRLVWYYNSKATMQVFGSYCPSVCKSVMSNDSPSLKFKIIADRELFFNSTSLNFFLILFFFYFSFPTCVPNSLASIWRCLSCFRNGSF